MMDGIEEKNEGFENQDGFENKEGYDKQEREEIFSQAVRAGKRTYFFDVKSTRKNDYYLTITESKKRFNKDGRYYFEKHKIFLYKEDFEKFADGMNLTINYIKENQPELISFDEELVKKEVTVAAAPEDYTNVEFEDLGNQ